MRSAVRRAPSGPTPTSTAANSSPPSLLAVSPGRRAPGAARHLYEQLVARRMAERVVDGFEIVEVEEENGRRGVPRALARSARGPRARTRRGSGRPVRWSWSTWWCSCSFSSVTSASDCSSRLFSSTTLAWPANVPSRSDVLVLEGGDVAGAVADQRAARASRCSPRSATTIASPIERRRRMGRGRCGAACRGSRTPCRVASTAESVLCSMSSSGACRAGRRPSSRLTKRFADASSGRRRAAARHSPRAGGAARRAAARARRAPGRRQPASSASTRRGTGRARSPAAAACTS